MPETASFTSKNTSKKWFLWEKTIPSLDIFCWSNGFTLSGAEIFLSLRSLTFLASAASVKLLLKKTLHPNIFCWLNPRQFNNHRSTVGKMVSDNSDMGKFLKSRSRGKWPHTLCTLSTLGVFKRIFCPKERTRVCLRSGRAFLNFSFEHRCPNSV